MKKYLIALVLFWFCFGFIQQQHIAVIGKIRDTADYSDITFWWRAEGTTLDGANDYSAGDTTATVVSEVAIAAGGRTNNAVQLVDGSNNGGDYYRFEFDVEEDLADVTTEGTMYFAFKLSVDTDYGSLVSLYLSATDRVFVMPIDTDELQVYWEEGDVTKHFKTTDLNYSANTWYIVQVHWNASTNARSLHVYLSSTGEEVGSGATSATAISGFTLTTSAYLAVGCQGAVNMEGFIEDVRLSKSADRDFLLLRTTDNYPG